MPAFTEVQVWSCFFIPALVHCSATSLAHTAQHLVPKDLDLDHFPQTQLETKKQSQNLQWFQILDLKICYPESSCRVSLDP